VSGGQQYATQTGSSTNNQIFQYQGNSGNYANAVQTGGSGNVAKQNQGGVHY